MDLTQKKLKLGLHFLSCSQLILNSEKLIQNLMLAVEFSNRAQQKFALVQQKN
jgi:hypothetical protein